MEDNSLLKKIDEKFFKIFSQLEDKRIEEVLKYGEIKQDSYLDDFVFLASTICETPIGLVTFVDKDKQFFKAKFGDVKDTETLREYAFCNYTIMGTGNFVVEDASKDLRFSSNPLVAGNPNIKFYAGNPLISNGSAIGSVCVIDNKPRKLNSVQLECLEKISKQISRYLQFKLLAIKLAG